MTKHTVSLRIKPLRRWGDVGAASKHGRRETDGSHINSDRTSDNMHWVFSPDTGSLEHCPGAPDLQACLHQVARRADATWHKGAIVATEVLFTAAPAFFSSAENPDALAKRWAEVCIAAWQDLFPAQSAAARLDLDETTPHLSIFFLPLHERTYDGSRRNLQNRERKSVKVSHNKTFGERKGPIVLSMLQDWYADQMERAGFALVRGARVHLTGNRNRTPQAGRQAVSAALQLAADIQADATERADQLARATEEKLVARLGAAKQKLGEARAAHEAERQALAQERAILDQKERELQQVMLTVVEAFRLDASSSLQECLHQINQLIGDQSAGYGPII